MRSVVGRTQIGGEAVERGLDVLVVQPRLVDGVEHEPAGVRGPLPPRQRLAVGEVQRCRQASGLQSFDGQVDREAAVAADRGCALPEFLALAARGARQDDHAGRLKEIGPFQMAQPEVAQRVELVRTVGLRGIETDEVPVELYEHHVGSLRPFISIGISCGDPCGAAFRAWPRAAGFRDTPNAG